MNIYGICVKLFIHFLTFSESVERPQWWVEGPQTHARCQRNAWFTDFSLFGWLLWKGRRYK